jgi:polyphosphate:AMP phosphotransferase
LVTRSAVLPDPVAQKLSKADYQAQVAELRLELLNAQYDLRHTNFSLPIMLTGIDRPAIEYTYQLLHEWLDARYIDANPCLEATPEERERPFVWRYSLMLPPNGRIGLFLDGWVKDLIGRRLLGEIDQAKFDQRLREMQVFTRALVDDGHVPLRFFFDLSKSDHKRRLKKADRQAERQWRVAEAERRFVENYDDARKPIQDLVSATGTGATPWIVFEDVNRRERNLIIGRTIRDAILAGIERSKVPAQPPRLDAPPSNKCVLGEIDLTQRMPKNEYRKRLDVLQTRLRKLALAARKKGRTSILAFEGWDAAGKGGAIRRLSGCMDARDYKVVPIAAPSEEEKRHHYLWRFWKQYPRAGRMLIFDRSWYGRVLVERVEGFATTAEWMRAYDEIRNFEEMLMENGTPLCKFWLHIDPDEQLRRFEEREKTGYKKYKITEEDYRNRGKWRDYEMAANEMINRTDTTAAPWHIVPANDKRSARIQVLRTVCDALEAAL